MYLPRPQTKGNMDQFAASVAKIEKKKTKEDKEN